MEWMSLNWNRLKIIGERGKPCATLRRSVRQSVDCLFTYILVEFDFARDITKFRKLLDQGDPTFCSW